MLYILCAVTFSAILFVLCIAGENLETGITIGLGIILAIFPLAVAIKVGAEYISEAKEKEAKAIEKEANAIEKLAEEIKKKELKVNIDSNEKKSRW